MLGRGEQETAEKILGNCALGTILSAVVLTVFFLVFGERILLLFGASENTIEYASSYMSIYAVSYTHLDVYKRQA